MKKVIAFGLMVALLVMVCDIPTLSEQSGLVNQPENEEYAVYRVYRDDLYTLQREIAQLYVESQKNPQAFYEHVLQLCERTAALTGKAEEASLNVHSAVQVSLQDYLEALLILGLTEEESQHLRELGYTDEDISALKTWFLYYNDSYHHAVTGFTPEEVERFHLLGLTDAQIGELQDVLHDHYTQTHAAGDIVKQHQRELLQIQATLTFAALQSLRELEKDKNKEKDKNSVLLNAEGKLLEAISTISEDQSSLEQVKAFSKEMYKAAEQEIRKGDTQYTVDFFIGLQIHCGAVTALSGDLALGLREIQLYRNVLEECASSPERPVVQVSSLQSGSASSPPPVQVLDFVGQVEESDETNNMGVTTVFVKTPDTSVWQAAVLLLVYISDAYGSTEWTLGGLIAFLEGCIEAGIAVTTLVLGAAGAVLLLIITAPAVGEEWPAYVPGTIEGEEITIIVEGSYGQGHITERAQSDKDPCIRSSHDAILKNPFKIADIVWNASKLFYYPETGEYLFYYVDNMGKEWIVIIRKFGNTKLFELRTAYRVDCPLPKECKPEEGGDPIPVHSYLDVLRCQEWKLINMR